MSLCLKAWGEMHFGNFLSLLSIVIISIISSLSMTFRYFCVLAAIVILIERFVCRTSEFQFSITSLQWTNWDIKLIPMTSVVYVRNLLMDQSEISLLCCRKQYFKTSCSDVEKQFTPSFICPTCDSNLYRYNENNVVKLLFRCPAI